MKTKLLLLRLGVLFLYLQITVGYKGQANLVSNENKISRAIAANPFKSYPNPISSSYHDSFDSIKDYYIKRQRSIALTANALDKSVTLEFAAN